jgi:hypothetical protein
MDPRYKPPSGSRREDQDFVERFRRGPGAISGEEATSLYERVAPNLLPEVYQRSAQEVFAQLTPEQRMRLGQALVHKTQDGAHPRGGRGTAPRFDGRTCFPLETRRPALRI